MSVQCNIATLDAPEDKTEFETALSWAGSAKRTIDAPERVTGLYGVHPTVEFVQIAELVENI